MHEFSIAKQIVRHLEKVEKQYNTCKIVAFEIELGELTFASKEQIKFWLQELLKGTKIGKAKINISNVKPIVKCDKCGYKGAIKLTPDPIYHFVLPDLRCKKCNSTALNLIKGRECNLRNVQIEKPNIKRKKTKDKS